MKVLVTGVKGQLGYDIVKNLSSHSIDVVGIDVDELDLTIEKDVIEVLNSIRPDVIIHCAAWTAVDAAEDEQNKKLCHKINVDGTKYLVEYAISKSIKIVYFSTDYVFNGELDIESMYNVDNEKDPINYYGYTKYLGEQEVLKHAKSFVIRISWVFGSNGANFVKTMLRLSETNNELNVVNDQFGSPTYTYDLSKLVYEMINSEKYGVYHATNEGICTWWDFATEVFDLTEKKIVVNKVDSTFFTTKAKRPTNSKLCKSSLDIAGFNRLPDWKDALKRYLKEIEVSK